MRQQRLTQQMKQGSRGQNQIADRFYEFGWVPSTPLLDLGEDFIVHIYINGVPKGYTFHAQVKSMNDISKHKKGIFITYRFRTKDLINWEGFGEPVVLILWDVNKREGCWGLVQNVIEELDTKRPLWRANKTKTVVNIPFKNNLKDQGLNLLKSCVGRHFYPQISKGKDLQILTSLIFPNTPTGKSQFEALDRHFKEGTPVSLGPETVLELHFSDWWEEWFGGEEKKNIELHLGQVQSLKTWPANIEIISKNGETASITNVEFQVIQAGTELIKMSSDSQGSPILFILEMHRKNSVVSGQILITFIGLGHNLAEIKNILKFQQTISLGGQLLLTFDHNKDNPITSYFQPQIDMAPYQGFVEIIDKLIIIQVKTGTIFNFPKEGIPKKEVKAINEMAEIIQNGKTIQTNGTVTIDLKGEALKLMLDAHRNGKPIDFIFGYDDSFVTILEKNISTGPMERIVHGFLEISADKFEEDILKLNANEFMTVKLINVTLTETFSNYNPN